MNTETIPEYYLHKRTNMTKLVLGNPERVLEIGCGAGLFRTNFKDNVEYWGVEPFAQAAEMAKQRLSRVFEGYYDEVSDKIPERLFDLIVCNDVIEHMPDPEGFLRNIQGKLADGGSMIVSVPNVRNAITLFDLLVRGDFQYVDQGVLDYTHFHLFTKNSFVRMAEKCGWSIDVCEPSPPQPFKLFKRVLLGFIKLFIPEIESTQIVARLRPKRPAEMSDGSEFEKGVPH